MRGRLMLAAALLLGACGEGATQDGALSADEEQQLDDAAAMLDEPEGEAEDVEAVEE